MWLLIKLTDCIKAAFSLLVSHHKPWSQYILEKNKKNVRKYLVILKIIITFVNGYFNLCTHVKTLREMTNTNIRAYSCKNEELPVLARFLLFSFRRDIAEFTEFSPTFDETYLQLYENRVVQAAEVIEPKSELALQKVITEKIHTTMDNLKDPINRVAAYLDLSQPELKISVDGFGVTELRKGFRAYDVEKTIKSLHTVCTNIATHFTVLNKYGLKQDLLQTLQASYNEIAADKQTVYEMQVNRRTMVQNNLSSFNELYEQMNEIMNIGKVLYKTSNPTRAKEYIFAELCKRIGNQSRTTSSIDETTSSAKA